MSVMPYNALETFYNEILNEIINNENSDLYEGIL